MSEFHVPHKPSSKFSPNSTLTRIEDRVYDANFRALSYISALLKRIEDYGENLSQLNGNLTDFKIIHKLLSNIAKSGTIFSNNFEEILISISNELAMYSITMSVEQIKSRLFQLGILLPEKGSTGIFDFEAVKRFLDKLENLKETQPVES